jgi:hypothetical protein
VSERYVSVADAVKAMRDGLGASRPLPRRRSSHWCFGHSRHENPAGAYQVCGECGHVYRSERDLVVLDADSRRPYTPGGAEPTPARSGEHVQTCPVCLHDF